MIGQIIGAVVRHGVGAAGGAVAAGGVAGGDDIQALVGAIMAAISIAWSIYQKRGGQ